jgi:hypothetical protein
LPFGLMRAVARCGLPNRTLRGINFDSLDEVALFVGVAAAGDGFASESFGSALSFPGEASVEALSPAEESPLDGFDEFVVGASTRGPGLHPTIMAAIAATISEAATKPVPRRLDRIMVRRLRCLVVSRQSGYCSRRCPGQQPAIAGGWQLNGFRSIR